MSSLERLASRVERPVRAEQQAEDELEALALEAINSGAPIEAGPDYWEGKHRRLDERGPR